jgi:hypothetical protein
METEKKSPNKLWRESGTSLSFADWIQREKDKGAFLRNKKFENFSGIDGGIDYSNWIERIKSENRLALGIDKIDNPNKKDDTVLGLSKPLLIISGLIIVGAIAYNIYQKRK